MNQAPFFWDEYSDQPHVIKDKAYKKAMRKRYVLDYVKLLLSSLIVLPFAILVMKFFSKKQNIDNSFFGMGVNLDKGNDQQELIEELGIKHLIIRLPLWEMDKIDEYVTFAQSFNVQNKKHILLNIMQDRVHIEDGKLLKEDLNIILTKFDGIVDEYQIGTTINRAKWGFFSVKEYLDFYLIAQKLKKEHFPHVQLIGPSMIDFEYYYTIRALFNTFNVEFDKVNALLYVDRRGGPSNTQYGFFDTHNKIDLLYTLVKLSSKCKSDDVYITEVNWPLSNTAPYAPTSEKECVSCDTYTKYMKEYHEIAINTGKVRRVYWHQLIAPGYGLVDNREGKLIKLPQFYAYKEMVQHYG
ncbi:MAG: hypothetical protein C0626_00045 [Arcobacter sp.]|uniref:hypothetical protein n=1 Tax=uncultured Arcobacter sp. TaxID=165434 RepID=UPI000CBE9B96|nr:hypothetical protein [uncultured Arcobacter sp.]PLY11003.1 MAG: hypothetical protein C0626_00045 [Arcobacter sp.]